jgi:hypothetical protein
MNNNQDKWHGSLPLYTTSVEVDYAEAVIVAPVDLEGGNILRVDMGLHKILVVQAVSLIKNSCVAFMLTCYLKK